MVHIKKIILGKCFCFLFAITVVQVNRPFSIAFFMRLYELTVDLGIHSCSTDVGREKRKFNSNYDWIHVIYVIIFFFRFKQLKLYEYMV